MNRTPHTSPFFSCLRACAIICHTTLAQVFVRVSPSMCHAPGSVFDLSSTLSLHSSFVSPIFYFILLIFHFIFYVGRFGARSLVRFENEEFGTFVNNAPPTRKETFAIFQPDVSHCCGSFHCRILSCLLMSTKVARFRTPCSTALDSA